MSTLTSNKQRISAVSWLRGIAFGALAGVSIVLALTSPASAATFPPLGTAASYGVLGGTTVTNTGPTTIIGDLGVYPGSSITGLGSITLSGAVHAGDAAALQAQSDVTIAYDDLAGQPCDNSFVGTNVEIGGQTLIPGVYCYSSSALLTGALILNGDGVYIFKTGSSLTTASGSSVSLIGGAQACNVFWQVGSSADLFTNTTFVGSILALTNINLQTGTTIAGRALARNAAVNLDTNTITAPTCTLAATPTNTPVAASATNTPIGAATATNTPFGAPSATPTVATTPVGGTTPVGSSTPAASTVVATPTGPAATHTQPTGLVPPSTGAPPASPIEPPASNSPPLESPPPVPKLPDAGSGTTPQSGSAARMLLLGAAVAGAVTVGFGIRSFKDRQRRRLVDVFANMNLRPPSR